MWYILEYMISYMIYVLMYDIIHDVFLYHVWYHNLVWYHTKIQDITYDITYDIIYDIMYDTFWPFLGSYDIIEFCMTYPMTSCFFLWCHMTQETVKTYHIWCHAMMSRKKLWCHNYVISHNCDIANFMMSCVISPPAPPASPPAPPASPPPTNWGDGLTWTNTGLIPPLDWLQLLLRP